MINMSSLSWVQVKSQWRLPNANLSSEQVECRLWLPKWTWTSACPRKLNLQINRPNASLRIVYLNFEPVRKPTDY